MPEHHLRFRLLEQRHHFALTEDLEFHLLELPKFTKEPADLSSRLDVWLYFLRHADTMDTDALPEALAHDPLVLRALEELKMLAQTDQERERYEARRKAQLDYNTGIKVARLEGRQEGLAEGRQEGLAEGRLAGLIILIHHCERLLGQPQTPDAHLASLPLVDLTRLADDLQARTLKQG